MTSDTTHVRIPGIFKLGLWLTLFNTWVLFEETIVDRHGLWVFMPYYHVGQLCAWDVGAAIFLGVLLWRLLRRHPLQQRDHAP